MRAVGNSLGFAQATRRARKKVGRGNGGTMIEALSALQKLSLAYNTARNERLDASGGRRRCKTADLNAGLVGG